MLMLKEDLHNIKINIHILKKITQLYGSKLSAHIQKQYLMSK